MMEEFKCGGSVSLLLKFSLTPHRIFPHSPLPKNHMEKLSLRFPGRFFRPTESQHLNRWKHEVGSLYLHCEHSEALSCQGPSSGSECAEPSKPMSCPLFFSAFMNEPAYYVSISTNKVRK